MSAMLDGEVTTAALCWRVERRDGVALGFTAHDRDIERTDFVYRAAPGMAPSAVMLSDGFDAPALDVRGALTNAAITAVDLAAGRWDGAAVTLLLVDWSDADAEPVTIAAGEIGDVASGGGGFEAELLGPAARLEQPVAEQTSPTCRAELGDARCRADMAARVRVTRVTAADEEAVTVAAAPGGGASGYGRLRWLSGANSGLESRVAASVGTALTLAEPPFRVPAAGDLVELHEGCDKRFETCVARFGNGANFRGEPHLPGMDLLTRYPGG